ncbi:hypothetical protein T484DRAFT_1808482 [Baffinella frigidus]|nr:hypothetical protein T484DRAFT_1808482 [Cryptophyta sp. CCMP2293]
MKVTTEEFFKTERGAFSLSLCLSLVTTEEFFKTERGAFEAVHWGSEVVGLVRVPLFVNETAELPDPTGLPNFLRGNFHQFHSEHYEEYS